MGRWGDGEMGRWGDGEMGRWGDGGARDFYRDELRGKVFREIEGRGYFAVSSQAVIAAESYPSVP
jgi:hypothetical protein